MNWSLRITALLLRIATLVTSIATVVTAVVIRSNESIATYYCFLLRVTTNITY